MLLWIVTCCCGIVNGSDIDTSISIERVEKRNITIISQEKDEAHRDRAIDHLETTVVRILFELNI